MQVNKKYAFLASKDVFDVKVHPLVNARNAQSICTLQLNKKETSQGFALKNAKEG